MENKALEHQKKPLVGDNCRSGPVGDGSTIVRRGATQWSLGLAKPGERGMSEPEERGRPSPDPVGKASAKARTLRELWEKRYVSVLRYQGTEVIIGDSDPRAPPSPRLLVSPAHLRALSLRTGPAQHLGDLG